MTYYTIVTHYYSVNLFRSADAVAQFLHDRRANLSEAPYSAKPLSKKDILELIINDDNVLFAVHPKTNDWDWCVECHEVDE